MNSVEAKPSYDENPQIITGDIMPNDGNGVGGRDSVWFFYPAVHSVMEAIKATSPDGGTKSRRSPEYTCE